MRILIATDAWLPQVNGVVRTYQRLEEELSRLSHSVQFVTPNEFYTVPCPTYPEIRLAILRPKKIREVIRSFKPDVVHIATEGPIGMAARRACRIEKRPFTTAYHTRFPEYIAKRFPIPVRLIYKVVRLFHNKGAGTMVATPSLARELEGRGFINLMPWTRGVDTATFKPRDCRLFGEALVAIYVGRVAPEKNLEAFLDLEIEAKKVIVGDGPSLQGLRRKYPNAEFVGAKEGEELAKCYSSGDVFVFPSRTDTFGIVLLEALSSGLPVAAYPVTGPIDIIEEGVTGCLSEDLKDAVEGALRLDPVICREKALQFSWERCAEIFIENLQFAEDQFEAQGLISVPA